MTRKRKTWKWPGKLFFCILCVCCIVGLAACAAHDDIAEREQTETENRKVETEAEFHSRFQSGLEAYFKDGSLVTGDKAVCMEYEANHEDEAVYTKAHVPVGYLTEDPAEVRYIIRYAMGRNVVGKYSTTESKFGIGGNAYEQWALVSVEDLMTGEILDESYFVGGPPPEEIEVEFGQFASTASGDPPDEKEITLWVVSVLRKNRQTETTVPTEEAAGTEQGREAALNAVDRVMEKGWNSYETVIWALEREGFAHEDAVYAADNCGADWKAEALKDAQQTLDFSKKEVLEFLENGGFTADEISYAMANCDANWKERALERAKNYLYGNPTSYNELIDALVSFGFTEEEAVYAADHCGVD